MIRFFVRLRFLPVTIFAAALMLTVKMGHIWEGLDGMLVGAISVAGAEAQQPAAKAPTPLTPAAKAPASPSAAAGVPPGTAVSSAPGVLPGVAGPANGGSVPANGPAVMRVDDPTLLTQSEIDLLQQLAVRRETIETREREINMREGLLKAAESRIDKKVQEMKLLQSTVEKLIATYSEQQAAKVASLVKIYENMKPKDAARIFEELDMDTLLLVAERMKERTLAPIMANMDPGKARDVTVDLARRRQLPQPVAAGG
jgi:flagellar motility protein MotE (MotC chaperone)